MEYQVQRLFHRPIHYEYHLDLQSYYTFLEHLWWIQNHRLRQSLSWSYQIFLLIGTNDTIERLWHIRNQIIIDIGMIAGIPNRNKGNRKDK